jgi:hypothetical protein
MASVTNFTPRIMRRVADPVNALSPPIRLAATIARWLSRHLRLVAV